MSHSEQLTQEDLRNTTSCTGKEILGRLQRSAASDLGVDCRVRHCVFSVWI